MQEIIAENLGPIPYAHFVIEQKGVTVFRGPSGIGKSILQKGIQDVVRGTGRAPLRDGAKRGKLSVGGATLTIGGKCSHTGKFEVEHIEGRFDISTLIDPGLKTPALADAARIKALVALTGVKADPVLFQTHEAFTDFDKIVKAESVKTDDLVEMARRIKSDYDEAARSAEDEAEREDGHANGLASHDDLDLTQESDAEILQYNYDKARDVVTQLEERQTHYEQEMESQRQAKEKIQELRDSGVGKDRNLLVEKKAGLERDVASLREEHEERRAKAKSSDQELNVLKAARTEYSKHYPDFLDPIEEAWKKLHAIRDTVGTLTGPVFEIAEMLENMGDSLRININLLNGAIDQFQKDCDVNWQRIQFLVSQIEEGDQKIADIQERLESIDQNEQTLAELERSLTAAMAAPPSTAELVAAREARGAARDAMDKGVLIRQAKKDIEKAKEHRAKAAKARDRADRYRHAGRSTDDVLSAAIPPGPLRIESDGKSARVVTDTERKKSENFHELSDGQRAKIALDIGAECVGKDGLLVIDQRIWEGIDGDNRVLIHEHAIKLDLYVLAFESTKEPGAKREIVPVPFGGEAE